MEDELLALRDQVVARVSPIHGKGVFAAKRLRVGARIGTFEGKATTQDGTYVLWGVDENGVETGIRGENDLRFLNHSKRPNAEFDGLTLIALRNIQPGAELLIDYGEAWDDIE